MERAILTTQVPPARVLACYAHAWRQLRRLFGPLLLVSVVAWLMENLVPGMIGFVLGVSAGDLGEPLGNLLGGAYFALVSLPLGAGFASAYLRAARGSQPRLADLFAAFSHIYPATLASALLLGAAAVLGALATLGPGALVLAVGLVSQQPMVALLGALLLLPGIPGLATVAILMMRLGYAPVLTVAEGLGPAAAFGESWRRTRGHIWALAGLALLGVGITIAAFAAAAFPAILALVVAAATGLGGLAVLLVLILAYLVIGVPAFMWTTLAWQSFLAAITGEEGRPAEAADYYAELSSAQSREDAVPVQIRILYPEPLSRWRLFVRWLAAIPLGIWGFFYGIVAGISTFFAFWGILLTGRYPEGLFRTVRGYLAFQYRVWSYMFLLCDRWLPDDDHPLKYEVEAPQQLSRLVLLLLKLPSFLLSIVFILTGFALLLLFLLALPAWWIVLVRARYPAGLFRFNVSVLRWVARTTTWQYLMCDDRSLFGTTRPVHVLVGVGVALVLLWPFGRAANLLLAASPGLLAASPGLPASLASTDFYTALGGAITGLVPGTREGENVLREFMQAGALEDVDAGLALTVGPPETLRPQVTKLFRSRQLFLGFEALGATSSNRNLSPGRDSLEMAGWVRYSSGSRGSFEATLLRDGDRWRIEGLQIGRE